MHSSGKFVKSGSRVDILVYTVERCGLLGAGGGISVNFNDLR